MAAAVGIGSPRLEAKPPGRCAGLLPLGFDQQRIPGIHIVPAQPLIGFRLGEDSSQAADAPEVIMAVSVVYFAPDSFLPVSESVEGNAALPAHPLLDGVPVAGGNDIRVGRGTVHHPSQPQRDDQVFLKAPIQAFFLQALNHLSQDHEVQIGIHHP